MPYLSSVIRRIKRGSDGRTEIFILDFPGLARCSLLCYCERSFCTERLRGMRDICGDRFITSCACTIRGLPDTLERTRKMLPDRMPYSRRDFCQPKRTHAAMVELRHHPSIVGYTSVMKGMMPKHYVIKFSQ